MPETSRYTPGITSPQDRIAILEDLVTFHCERNDQHAGQILSIVAALEYADIGGLSRDELRTRIVRACARLTRLAQDVAISNLNTEEFQTVLRRWPFMAHRPGMPS